MGSKDETCSCCGERASRKKVSFYYFLIQRETVTLVTLSSVLREAKDRPTFGNDSCHQAPRPVTGGKQALNVVSENPTAGMTVDGYLIPLATGAYILKIKIQQCFSVAVGTF